MTNDFVALLKDSSLVSVLVTDDGRILAGAVGVDQLVAASQR